MLCVLPVYLSTRVALRKIDILGSARAATFCFRPTLTFLTFYYPLTLQIKIKKDYVSNPYFIDV